MPPHNDHSTLTRIRIQITSRNAKTHDHLDVVRAQPTILPPHPHLHVPPNAAAHRSTLLIDRIEIVLMHRLTVQQTAKAQPSNIANLLTVEETAIHDAPHMMDALIDMCHVPFPHAAFELLCPSLHACPAPLTTLKSILELRRATCTRGSPCACVLAKRCVRKCVGSKHMLG